VPLAVGSALMAGAIAFQAWVSVAKPWSTTRWMPADRRQVAGTAPRWVFVATVVGVAADLTVAALLGHPAPLISLVILGTWLVLRRRQAGADRPGGTTQPDATPAPTRAGAGRR
jgi:hypothetical protein